MNAELKHDGLDIDALWRDAVSIGLVTAQSRTDARGAYVYVRCIRPEGLDLICTAATIYDALRAISAWGQQGYFRVELQGVGGVWRPAGWTHYANPIAAEKAAQRISDEHPAMQVRFVPVEPL